MAVQLNSPGWRVQTTSRGAPGGADNGLKTLPDYFLTPQSRVSDEIVLEPAARTRGQAAATDTIDLSTDVEPGQLAVLAIRHPSGALTFHVPVQSTSRGLRGPALARFQVPLRRRVQTRGVISQAVKAIVIKVAQLGADKLVSLLLPKLVEALEKRLWKEHGLTEGWLRVTKETLASGHLAEATPVSPERSLLLIHGTFSNAASAFRSLATSAFFDRVKDTYADRIFAFDHFTLSRTPAENARMLLEELPDQATRFDVITHSRGGLVLRTLVEEASQFGRLAGRFELQNAVLVASPNDGTPLATPDRWDKTVGWFANLLELFPDNPFTTGVQFVANGIVWLANHASGDVPGLHAMDSHGEPIAKIQAAPGPSPKAYSALVANYQPTANLQRFLDVGLDEFFGSANDLVVPTEGGWKIDRTSTLFIPDSRIGCFGPGGNLPKDTVTHVNFFAQAETADFLVRALEGQPQPLKRVDPRQALPDRRLFGAARGMTAAVTPPSPVPPAAPSVAVKRRRRREEPVAPAAIAGGLEVTVVNGDVTFERAPLLLGHYAATQLTGTERVVNTLVGKAMERALDVGLYPHSTGSHQIFLNRHTDGTRSPMPRPEAVIVVGLGAEGSLQSAELVKSVRLAVIGWARRVAEDRPRGDAPATFTLASTLIASGGTGVSAGQSARLILQGISEANELLRTGGADTLIEGLAADGSKAPQPWPQCNCLRLIELYLDRASEAWRALKLQREVTPNAFTLAPLIKIGQGAMRRPTEAGYRGAAYDFITVEEKRTVDGLGTIEFTLDTRRARSEVRGKRTQSQLISQLVESASNEQNRDARIGRTLFNLLIPIEIEPYLAGTGEMVIALDPETAAVPWELLDIEREGGAIQKPWAISVKLLRKLRLDVFRDKVRDAQAQDWALVIGEPACPAEYPRLFGAREEAIAVNERLLSPGGIEGARVTLLGSTDTTKQGCAAEEVINTLFEKPWRIVHVAGHGFPGKDDHPGGVVLSNGTFLGPDEIRSMRTVPELVFVNCCYLARAEEKSTPNARYDRTRFASGVAGALIENGVKCVVAAGWAVDDDVAKEFAAEFYASVLRNERFIDAVGNARTVAYDRFPHSSTWAAYQCYGDPDWRFHPKAPDPNRAEDPEQFSDIASAFSLELALDRIAVESKLQNADLATQRNKLHKLEGLFAETLGGKGTIAEAFGRAFSESGDMIDAIRWYTRAADSPDGLASFKAAEQLANAKSRLGWELVEKVTRHRDNMAARLATLDRSATRTQKSAARRALADAKKRLPAAIKEAQDSIAQSLALLDKLAHLKSTDDARHESTMERQNLIGSAFKRRALVNLAAGRSEAVVRGDLLKMKKAYAEARRVGAREPGADLFYSASNLLASDIALDRGGSKALRLDAEVVAQFKASVDARAQQDADFWSVVSGIELDEYQAMADRTLAHDSKGLLARYRHLHERVTSPRMWASVYDNAFLVLGCYSREGSARPQKEKQAAEDLLAGLRTLAHGDSEEQAQ